MASKTTSKRTTMTTTTSSSTSNVAGTSQATQQRSSVTRKSATPTPAAAQGDTSPLSPTKFGRIQEKAELASLNDRLACYIDRVRHLEAENGRLTREVHTHQETVAREVTSVKSMYENELADARRLLDDLSREKARLEIDTRRMYEELEELKTNLDAKTKGLGFTQTSLSVTESKLNDLSVKFNQVQAERKRLADENKALEKERNKLLAQLAETRKMLEEETLHRVDLENSVQTAKEDLSFKEQMYQQQMSELRTKRQVEISEIDGRLTQEYEEKLYQSLQEIREQYEIDLNSNKEEIKHLYEDKIKSLANQLTRNSNASSMAMDEVRKMQGRTDSLTTRVTELEAEVNSKNQKLRDLEKLLETERGRFMNEFSKLDEELTKLRNEMAHQLQEYQDLMDIKVALDLEISVYRKLLEGEEARLNITPVTSPSGRQTPRKSVVGRAKRKRTMVEESEETSSTDYSWQSSAKGDIEMADICLEGKFVKLKNKGAKEISLSGWQLIRKAGDATTVYKFPRTVKIDAGNIITIWSSDSPEHIHEPPENITMKSQKWMIGDHMTTALLNSQGEDVASVENKKQQVSSNVSRLRETGGFYPKRGASHPSELFQAADTPEEERCCIM